jgi:hypothetical protein
LRHVAAFYSQFIGLDAQRKVDAIVEAFEAKIARGEVRPSYSTYPPSAPVAAAEPDKRPRGDENAVDGGGRDGEVAGGAGLDGDRADGGPAAAKRPRVSSPDDAGAPISNGGQADDSAAKAAEHAPAREVVEAVQRAAGGVAAGDDGADGSDMDMDG